MRNSKGIIKIIKRSICFLLILLIILIAGLMSFILLGKNKTLHITIGDTPLTKVEDGVYTGSYQGFRWSNSVEVTVKNHEIIGIRTLRSQVFAKQETIDAMTQRILSAQSTDVDVISGATADSKAYLKAVENALEQQENNN